MPALLALMVLALCGLAAPAAACTAGGGSTFCADGWISVPVTRERRESADPGLSGDGAATPDMEGDGEVWVDGAVPVDGDPVSGDEGL